MDTSPFSLLPRELRDIIYEYVFTTPYAVTLQSEHIEHPLTKTCSQLRRETLLMYFSLTRFNAHLDDGPPTPLARWLKTIGPELALTVEEINVWDLHDRNATLHGAAATKRLLGNGNLPSGKRYILQPLCNRTLNGLVPGLREIGLSILRFCVLADEAEGESQVEETSEFAMVRLEAYVDESDGRVECSRTHVLENSDSGRLILPE